QSRQTVLRCTHNIEFSFQDGNEPFQKFRIVVCNYNSQSHLPGHLDSSEFGHAYLRGPNLKNVSGKCRLEKAWNRDCSQCQLLSERGRRAKVSSNCDEGNLRLIAALPPGS